ENTGDADDPWVAEDFERLILRRESDPVKMDCEGSGKNGQVKINARERRETERDAEEVQSFHGGNMLRRRLMSRNDPYSHFRVVHASRVLASASSRSRTF